VSDDGKDWINPPIESYVVKTDNILTFDPNLAKIDLYNFKITKCLYKLRVNITKALRAENYTVAEYTSTISTPVLNISKVEKPFKEVVDELEKNPLDENLQSYAFKKYPFLNDAIVKLGYEGIKTQKYVVTNIKKKLASMLNISNESKVAKMLKQSSYLSSGSFVPAKKAKELVQKCYEVVGVNKTPNIKDFYEVKDCSKRVDGKPTQGYIIIMPKIILN
jgi:predicted ABC-class ATPase